MSKQFTIDELLIKNGITHLTGKEHDGIIIPKETQKRR